MSENEDLAGRLSAALNAARMPIAKDNPVLAAILAAFEDRGVGRHVL